MINQSFLSVKKAPVKNIIANKVEICSIKNRKPVINPVFSISAFLDFLISNFRFLFSVEIVNIILSFTGGIPIISSNKIIQILKIIVVKLIFKLYGSAFGKQGMCVTAAVLALVGLKSGERREIRRFLGRKWHEWELDHRYEKVAKREWKRKFGTDLNLDHPRDLNEKIQWLMCRSDISAWTPLSDKVAVRDYVAEKGLGDLLVPLLGTWKRAKDIPWDTLPEKFVLKCNHDSGSTHIVDRSTNRAAVSAALDEALKAKYGYRHGEMHYNGIDPCILAEQYLDSGDAVPVDYKVWCFDGKPYCIWACHGRTAEAVYVNVYDLDWTPRPEASVFTDHYRDGGSSLPKPETLPQMLAAAAKLSEGLPEVRVDFYEVQGKLYFGEMTFASLMGRMDFYTPEFLQELGDQVKLPTR